MANRYNTNIKYEAATCDDYNCILFESYLGAATDQQTLKDQKAHV